MRSRSKNEQCTTDAEALDQIAGQMDGRDYDDDRNDESPSA